jgi:alanyl-tRNA synthetase
MPTERLYYNDAYLREFTARILTCDAIPPDVAAGRVQQAWAVTLDRTALYPTSGGQPHDLGKLGDANILEVRDDGDEILHIIDRELPVGPVAGCVDSPRRFDHMQQHTGQHLLSAIFQERFGLATVSFHLGEDFSTIDLHGPEPSEEIFEGVERFTNKIIFEDRPIVIRYATQEQLAEMGARKQVQREGLLRVIEIPGADLQPCGGTHVASTGQIGTLLIRRRGKIRLVWRIEFVCGARAERAARADFRHLRDLAQQLNCAPEEALSATKRLLAERDAHFAALRATVQQLAIAEAELTLQQFPENADKHRVVDRIVENAQPEFLSQFATAMAKHEKVIALVAASETGDLLFAQRTAVGPASGHDMSALLKRVLAEVGGKGGGTKDFARGKLSDPNTARKALELAKTFL